MKKLIWRWIIPTIILTAILVWLTYRIRGYFSVGGEWLTPMYAFTFYKTMQWEIKNERRHRNGNSKRANTQVTQVYDNTIEKQYQAYVGNVGDGRD